MRRKTIRHCICLLLIASLVGCRTTYDLDLYSNPSGATVTIGGQVYGFTPCKVEIPKDSEYIEDHLIEISFALPDGRTITKTYDLREFKWPNPLAQFFADVFVVPGALLLKQAISVDDEEEEDEYYFTSEEEDDEEDDDFESRLGMGLVGIGLIGVGSLIGWIFGVFDEKNDIFVVFQQPR